VRTGNTQGIARAPAPLGTGVAQGGLSDPSLLQNFPAFWIFVRKNPGVRTFARNFFGFFRFQTGKNPAGKISSQKFLGFSTFNRKFFWF